MSERHSGFDIAITDAGDLQVDISNDVAIISNIEYVAQSVKNRIRSVANNWYYDNIGADIEKFIGQPNTQDTANKIESAITSSLTYDGFCNNEDVAVFASPLNSVTVLIGVFIDTDFQDDPISFSVELNFLTGFRIVRKS